MNKISWSDIVEAAGKYADSMAEYKTICEELEFGSKTITNYPGLCKTLIDNLKNK